MSYLYILYTCMLIYIYDNICVVTEPHKAKDKDRDHDKAKEKDRDHDNISSSGRRASPTVTDSRVSTTLRLMHKHDV